MYFFHRYTRHCRLYTVIVNRQDVEKINAVGMDEVIAKHDVVEIIMTK